MGEPAEGQAVSTDGARVHAVSGQGQEAVQKSPKVKRKGRPARGEQLRTEEMKVMTLLVTFELRVILILEMTKLRLTRLSDLPKVIQLPSDEAGVQTCFPGSQHCHISPVPSTHRCLGSGLADGEAIWPLWPWEKKQLSRFSPHVWCQRVGVLWASQAQGVMSATPPPPATRCPDESELY